MQFRSVSIQQLPPWGAWLACEKLPKPLDNAEALHFAVAHGRIDILDWYKHHNLDLKIYSDTPCFCDDIKVLKWLDENNLLVKCHPTVISAFMPTAPRCTQNWWVQTQTTRQSVDKHIHYYPCRLKFDIRTKCLRKADGSLTFFH